MKTTGEDKTISRRLAVPKGELARAEAWDPGMCVCFIFGHMWNMSIRVEKETFRDKKLKKEKGGLGPWRGRGLRCRHRKD